MEIRKLNLGGPEQKRPIVIAGPCSAESREQVIETAESLAARGIGIFRAGIWKPRTKPGGFEGAGAAGFEWLREAKRRTGMLMSTEVATARHVLEALKAKIDVLWIGARTTANPFAVQELADALRGTDVPVLIKNPVSPDVELWCGAIQRFYNAGITNIGIIHRGFSSSDNRIYRNIPLWHIPIEMKRRFPEITMICDPSHMGGRRDLIAPLSQQALDLMFDGLIIESHCNPDCALSDAQQQLTPEALGEMLGKLTVRDNIQTTENIDVLRGQIDEIDNNLLALLAKRMRISREIGTYKKEHNMPVLQSRRYDEIQRKRAEAAKILGLDEEFVAAIMESIHRESVDLQMKLMKEE